MGSPRDWSGDRVGMITILHRVPRPEGKKSKSSWWMCLCDCGAQKAICSTTFYKTRAKSCGCVRLNQLKSETGPKNRGWKGGRTTHSEGYVSLRIPDHPRAKSNGYVLEHLVVMEQKLGRPVLRSENVHHINGIKSDNRIENLELWVITQPRGQRVSDLVKRAKEILETYGSL